LFKKQQLFSHRFTQMNADSFKHKEITDIILRSFNKAQLINYLKATNIEEGLLLNFGQKPELNNPVALLEHDLRFVPTSYGGYARYCSSQDLYMMIKKTSVIISVDRWLSNYKNDY